MGGGRKTDYQLANDEQLTNQPNDTSEALRVSTTAKVLSASYPLPRPLTETPTVPVLKTRVERLEKDNDNGVPLATIPARATLEEATRIFNNNLKLGPQRPIQISTQPMTLEEATAIFEPYRTMPTRTPKTNSDAKTKT